MTEATSLIKTLLESQPAGEDLLSYLDQAKTAIEQGKPMDASRLCDYVSRKLNSKASPAGSINKVRDVAISRFTKEGWNDKDLAYFYTAKTADDLFGAFEWIAEQVGKRKDMGDEAVSELSDQLRDEVVRAAGLPKFFAQA